MNTLRLIKWTFNDTDDEGLTNFIHYTGELVHNTPIPFSAMVWKEDDNTWSGQCNLINNGEKLIGFTMSDAATVAVETQLRDYFSNLWDSLKPIAYAHSFNT